jgi:hypothetical protein
MNAEDVYRMQFSSSPARNHGYRMGRGLAVPDTPRSERPLHLRSGNKSVLRS